MAFKKAAIAGLALGWAVSVFMAQEARKPLVRRDLLVFGSGEIAAPVRDIFRPRATALPAVRRAGGPAVKSAAVTQPDAPPSFTLNLSYIGSIKSGGQIIALVLRNGQTVSVGEGDEIAPGYKVVGVTAEAIVVQGPNSERRTFPLKGDRP
ncbi:MAG: hypothetical protein A2Y70_01110 [Candidatus Aminicenantes bacterium RBG_13_64_14]|nr:MAG: hypothetical protein A2Y70_01110 [Candidatus Aminicenantes bacterium RBG_13_64_14]